MMQTSFEQKIASFFMACKDHLEGKLEEVPSLTIDSSQGKQKVEIYFDDELAEQILKKPKDFKKPIKALKYGYVGSKKGLNGIRDIHENDGKIFGAVCSALDSGQGNNIMERYFMQRDRINPVKIVAHETSGRRLYGFMDKGLKRVVFFGVGHYK